MSGPESILVRILASTDSVWLPIRQWRGRLPQNVGAARRAYASNGVPWASNAHGPAGWKAAQRDLEALAGDGLVVAAKPRSGARTLGVRLSADGMAAARRLVGLPSVGDSWQAAHALGELSRRPAKWATDVWIAEARLAEPADFGRLEMKLLPALVAGHVESGSDIRGRVSYRLTPSGWAWLAEPPEPDGPGEYNAEADAAYMEHLRAALARLEMAEVAEPRELGALPLPEAMGGLRAAEVI